MTVAGERHLTMQVQQIPLDKVEISEHNTRKDLEDGQQDSSIDDLAESIRRHGLLSPVTVYQKPNGRYEVVAGQRRTLACRRLGHESITAVVRDTITDVDGLMISLVENVHRADMNPRDKASAFRKLVAEVGSVAAASRATGVGEKTIRKYVALGDLSPELQARLAAGETRNTEALARLAQRFTDPSEQTEIWDQIGGFRQDIQQDILQQLTPDLGNLELLRDRAAEGELGITMIRRCPRDCPTIPELLKPQVEHLISEFTGTAT